MFKKILYFFIFLIAYFIGIILGICDGMEETSFSSSRNSYIENIFTENKFNRFISIAKNNVSVGLKNFLLGFFSLGILSLVYSFYNGFVLGFVIGKSTKVLTIKEILETTIPNCSEIIGIVLMGYLGFILSIRILFNTSIITKKEVSILLGISLIIIIISAYLESYVSMSIQ